MTPQLARDLLQPRQPTLATYVPGRNAEALAALRRLAAGELPERQVYLWGELGSGRTHLLTALAATAGGYFWTPASDPEAPGLAVVDEVERLDAAAQVALFNRINAVRAHVEARCALAGALPPAQLALREDLRTRLAWGLVYQLHPLDDAEKAAALHAHAAARGATVSDDLIPYLLTHLPRDLRTLVAVLDALDAYALARQRPLTVPLLKDWLHARG
ncbi:MAG: DnaA regulatory inactivator Hda [Betaproteobacteria bacterium]